eukprot:TRINITY_DN965_c0_g1_i1.p1 TRINITY_DN965_c0_g1~~TRINITY_DN965_c0_g1_i1.p1  ORF type:complete len:1119 (-),score=300.14 TRINITY_DN965_c0_g1_i1:22-3324(-)
MASSSAAAAASAAAGSASPLVYDKRTNRFFPANSVRKDETRPLLRQTKLVDYWNGVSRVLSYEYWKQKPLVKRLLALFEPKYLPRTIRTPLDPRTSQKFPSNVTRNQRYSVLSFLPVTLFEQFSYFYNMYFLLIALTQFIPILQVGYLFTYWLPLIFVVVLALAKEAFDDIKRWLQDRRANHQKFQRLMLTGEVITVRSSDIRVGHLVIVNTNERVPADLVLLHTSDKSGASFIRTDQLDGETDWKLRKPLAKTQSLSQEALASYSASFYIEEPKKEIYNFIGKLTDVNSEEEPISVDNTMWANTVVASGKAVGLVVYTGRETRSALNKNKPTSKVGITDLEVNFLSKILFVMLATLSLLMVAVAGFTGLWYVNAVRFMILFSSIIPISMRVNLDMAKLLYSAQIMWDKKIPGTVVRSSNLPEELGRINFLFSDKTGTLTQNDMVFKKLHVGSMCFRAEDQAGIQESMEEALGRSGKGVLKHDRGGNQHVLRCVRALALCHNVTPVTADDGSHAYQASSPDEVALVKFTEKVSMVLSNRDIQSITLHNPLGEDERYEVLHMFPFSSSTKRMGIVVRDLATGGITFYLKGADSIMIQIISKENSEWVPEETENMARDGLRTLVFGMKNLSEEELQDFTARYHEAKCSLENRDSNMQAVVETLLERDLEVLCVTGVEDRLQEGVRPTLEKLQAAGVKVWMLTGDKVETATCIALSARLFKRDQPINTITARNEQECYTRLCDCDENSCLVIDGNSLQMCLDSFRDQFFQIAQASPSVVCCRCSPTQKAEVVRLIKQYTNARTAAIGDGGNDVSMILAADVGLGIEGREGKQASLAADFSLTQFYHVLRLTVWHGRNSYKRSSLLAQFIIHRGLVISFIQAVFSCLVFFAAVAIYQGWLLVGYSTIYTMAPVFSLVLDEDVSARAALTFAELYHDLQKGRVLSMRTFLQWTFASVYQGGAIMVVSMMLFESNFLNIVAITFTVLILTELLNIAFEIHNWNWLILVGELLTLLIYIGSIFLLPDYFDTGFILTWSYWWRVFVVTAVSCLPISLTKFIYRKCNPTADRKVTGHRHGKFKAFGLGDDPEDLPLSSDEEQPAASVVL